MGIVLDTETTGLLMPRLSANELQPQVIEVYLGRFDEKTYEITEELNLLIKPLNVLGEQLLLEAPINNLKHIVRITGICDTMLVNAPTFAEVAEKITEFCKDEDLLVAHNLMFDFMILVYNYRRITRPELMPYFRRRACTVEMSYCLQKKRLTLAKLYQIATGEVFEDAHRAKFDALATLKCFKWLIEDGL